jgi:RsiW-degrading membrane proteinase PrsW (M82 family)
MFRFCVHFKFQAVATFNQTYISIMLHSEQKLHYSSCLFETVTIQITGAFSKLHETIPTETDFTTTVSSLLIIVVPVL